MATFSYQILKDTTQTAMIKLTGEGLTSDETSPYKISANSLSGALNTVGTLLSEGGTAKSYYDLTLYRLWYDINFNTGASAVLTWNGTTPKTIFTMGWSGEYNTEGNFAAIPNNNKGNPGVIGDVGFYTSGVTKGSYTIIVELVKNSLDYNNGQLTEPSAFNYGNYSITP